MATTHLKKTNQSSLVPNLNNTLNRRLVLKENADRYRLVNETRFREPVGRLRSQGVPLRA